MIIPVFCALLAVISAQEVEDEITTPAVASAAIDHLKNEASAQCSYRYSNNIYSVSEAQCRQCVGEWTAPVDALTEDKEKTVYRMTYDCRPMKNSKEYLRKLCRSSGLPDRQSLDSYANCDGCLSEHGVKENGTTFDEFVNARRACIRVGHKVMVITSYFGGRMRQIFKHSYDYELLREKTRAETCTEHFDEQVVTRCQKCLDDLFLWPEAPVERNTARIKTCISPLTLKEIMAKACHLLEDPTLKHILQARDIKTCHACFNESNIDDASTVEEKLAVSFSCLPPANPAEELQVQLCEKIERHSIFTESATDQPRDLCFAWVTAKNLSAGISYDHYKTALHDVMRRLQQHIAASCDFNSSVQEIEKCRACVDLALSSMSSLPGQIRRWDFVRSFRCIVSSRNPGLKAPPEPVTTPAPDDIDIGLLPDDTSPNNGGLPKRIASDS